MKLVFNPLFQVKKSVFSKYWIFFNLIKQGQCLLDGLLYVAVVVACLKKKKKNVFIKTLKEFK
jgi:hypothetical protein